MTTTDTPRRYMTVVYEIVDETEWRKTNPLRYAHNGLFAVRVSVDDACELLDEAKAEVERLRSQLERAVEIARGFCGCGCGGDYGLCNFCADQFSELDQLKATLNQTDK